MRRNTAGGSTHTPRKKFWEYKPGEWVEHDHFGLCEVVSESGLSPEQKVRVRVRSDGKTRLVRHLNIKAADPPAGGKRGVQSRPSKTRTGKRAGVVAFWPGDAVRDSTDGREYEVWVDLGAGYPVILMEGEQVRVCGREVLKPVKPARGRVAKAQPPGDLATTISSRQQQVKDWEEYSEKVLHLTGSVNLSNVGRVTWKQARDEVLYRDYGWPWVRACRYFKLFMSRQEADLMDFLANWQRTYGRDNEWFFCRTSDLVRYAYENPRTVEATFKSLRSNGWIETKKDKKSVERWIRINFNKIASDADEAHRAWVAKHDGGEFPDAPRGRRAFRFDSDPDKVRVFPSDKYAEKRYGGGGEGQPQTAQESTRVTSRHAR